MGNVYIYSGYFCGEWTYRLHIDVWIYVYMKKVIRFAPFFDMYSVWIFVLEKKKHPTNVGGRKFSSWLMIVSINWWQWFLYMIILLNEKIACKGEQYGNFSPF